MANDAGTTSEDRSSRMFEPMTGSDAAFLGSVHRQGRG
jgi:hypothetical protein